MKIITELLFCVALYSFQPTHWVQEPSDLANNDLIAQGKKNVWICHVEDKKTIGDFQSFVQVVSDSKVDVQMMQKDSFIECLEENSCISGDIVATSKCLLSNVCSLQDHHKTSNVAQCFNKQIAI